MSETSTAYPRDFAGRRQAAWAGARIAIGVPAIVLGASFVGFGALVQQVGLSLWHALFSTATGWALPGQVALVELYAVGSSVLVIALAVGLTNARLLPMAITLMPLVRAPGVRRWHYYTAANWVAVTGWAIAMRDCPAMPPAQRLPYFMGVVLVLWAVSMLGSWFGFALAGNVPFYVTLGLVFLNPIYFMLLLATDVRARSRVLATLFGAAAGTALHLVIPDWSLLIAGIAGGTLAYYLGRTARGGR